MVLHMHVSGTLRVYFTKHQYLLGTRQGTWGMATGTCQAVRCCLSSTLH